MVLQPGFADFEQRFNRGENQIVYAQLAADLDTPVSLMMKLAGAGDHSFILESVTGGEIRGRYSIVGLKPDIIWECRNGESRMIREAGKPGSAWGKRSSDPIGSLRALIDECRIELPEGLPAASSGIFGYLGYDVVRLVEDLPNLNPDTLGLPDAVLIRPTVVAVLDGVKGSVTIVSPAWHDPGTSAQRAFDQASQRVMAAVRDIEERVPQERRQLGPPLAPVEAESNTTRDEYIRMVERAKRYIREGDIFQVVPSQRWHQSFELPPFEFYRALRQTNPSPFMFFFNFGDFQVIGASPEILVRVFGKEITVRPIAGTRPRGENAEEDKALADELLSDEKERAEHLMLLDLGRNDVGRVSEIGTVRPTESFVIERYSHVMHIVSNVVGKLADRHDALSALLAGLPAGTVSGAPKIRAMEIIDELEKEKRTVYAGGVGYFSANGDMDMCIALRTAVLKDGCLHIQAGGGVVQDSDPESEWLETVNKAQALRRAAEVAGQFARNKIRFT